MAKPGKRVRKKVEKKNVPNGVAHIQATFNNTIITFTDVAGNVISWCTSGSKGFRGKIGVGDTQLDVGIAGRYCRAKISNFGKQITTLDAEDIGGFDIPVDNAIFCNTVYAGSDLQHQGANIAPLPGIFLPHLLNRDCRITLLLFLNHLLRRLWITDQDTFSPVVSVGLAGDGAYTLYIRPR